jgi:hypothetical protein
MAAAETITLEKDGKKDTYTILEVLEGSTEPRLVQNTEGTKFVLKLSSKHGGAQEANEYLAFQLYNAAGCRVPDTYLVTDTATKIPGLLEEFIEGVPLSVLAGDPRLKSTTFPAIQNDLVIHALLANWDINVRENIMIPFAPEGSFDYAHPYTIDCGGTLQFRAMGGIKPYTSNEMANIRSIVHYAKTSYTSKDKPMAQIKWSELKGKICDRWRSVDQGAILAAFEEVAPKVRPIFAAAKESYPEGLAGLDLDMIKTVLQERMRYLDETYCNMANSPAGGAGAGAGAAITTGGGRRTLRKTRKQRRKMQRRQSHRRRV